MVADGEGGGRAGRWTSAALPAAAIKAVGVMEE